MAAKKNQKIEKTNLQGADGDGGAAGAEQVRRVWPAAVIQTRRQPAAMHMNN